MFLEIPEMGRTSLLRTTRLRNLQLTSFQFTLDIHSFFSTQVHLVRHGLSLTMLLLVQSYVSTLHTILTKEPPGMSTTRSPGDSTVFNTYPHPS